MWRRKRGTRKAACLLCNTRGRWGRVLGGGAGRGLEYWHIPPLLIALCASATRRRIPIDCLFHLPLLTYIIPLSFVRRPGVDVPKISFSKYHGIGNDFILIDNRQSEKPILSAEQCKEVGREGGREGGRRMEGGRGGKGMLFCFCMLFRLPLSSNWRAGLLLLFPSTPSPLLPPSLPPSLPPWHPRSAPVTTQSARTASSSPCLAEKARTTPCASITRTVRREGGREGGRGGRRENDD